MADGDDEFPTFRQELRAIESRIAALESELKALGGQAKASVPVVHPTWITSQLERLCELLQEDPARAKVEIMQHLDGDVRIFPMPSPSKERRAEIRGAVKLESLLPLSGQEARWEARIAGVGFEPTTSRL